MIKKIIKFKLRFLAKRVLKKYKPEVVGITGSVGKTSAKEAVAAVLGYKYRIRKSEGNYNNEIGMPLTIMGLDSPGKSVFGWLRVIWQGTKLWLFRDKHYPEILILEMGADRPGDIEYLMRIAKPDIGIITRIGESHLEYFKSLDGVRKEKGALVRDLKKTGWAVINFDDKDSTPLIDLVKSNLLTFGLEKGSDVWAPAVEREIDTEALNFKLQYKGSFVPVILPRTIARTNVYAALAGAATGIIKGMNLVDISAGLKNYISPKGRMNLLEGIKGTFIFDDTYNSSPQSSVEALETFSQIEFSSKTRRFAVLGDMLELGRYSEEGHLLVGEKVFESGIDYLIAVGERSRDTARGAREAGMSEDFIFHFDTPEEAGKFIQDRIESGDAVLVKGSQGARMEKVVKEIMAEPLRAEELLVRQTPDWLNK